MINVDTVAQACHCGICYHPCALSPHIDQAALHTVLTTLGPRYGNRLVLFGGQLATPLVYGFTKMRRHTNDIDYIVHEDLLPDLVRREHLDYIPGYGVFYGYFEGILAVFMCGRIHNWRIPKTFFDEALDWPIGGVPVHVSTRDTLIALKFRRGTEYEPHLFGKDGVDLVNLLTAPAFRDDLGPHDWDRLCERLLAIAGPRVFELLPALRKAFHNHMPKKRVSRALIELQTFEEALRRASKHICTGESMVNHTGAK
ncbi:MAG: hypothetical protein ACYTGH_05295 [Planctomycetota bacterium]|jgi:hypothetical protein